MTYIHPEKTIRGQLERMKEDRDYLWKKNAELTTMNTNQTQLIGKLERDIADIKRERDWARQMCQHLVQKIPGARS